MKYPLEYRKKVLEIKAKKGISFKELSEYFDISTRTLCRCGLTQKSGQYYFLKS
jgi:hypothetical protein